MKAYTTEELNVGLDDEARALLWRMCAFVDNWGGKLIDYRTGGQYPDQRKGYVRGHDGPFWMESDGRWHIGDWTMGSQAFGGWGSVVIENSRGSTHHIDPKLIVEVSEIARLSASVHTIYDHEAVDLFCIYNCDPEGLRDWDVDWDGPEYEVFCPIHSRAAYEEARAAYDDPRSTDGTDRAFEERYFELIKIAYRKVAA